MTYIVSSDYNMDREFLPREKHEYDYPKGLDFSPGSELHKKIIKEVMDRAATSSTHISKRFNDWKKVDESLTVYIKTDDAEKKVQEDDERKPVSIVFPYSYALLETLMSYMTAAFLQDPIFRYQRLDGGSPVGAILLERVIQQHNERHKNILNMLTMIRDNFVYGFGAVACGWGVVKGFKPKRKILGVFDRLRGFRPTGFDKEVEEGVIFEGNDLSNIDVFKTLPDPNVPVYDIQKMEYFGWVDETNLGELLKQENGLDDDLFNVKYLKQIDSLKTSIYRKESGRETKAGLKGRVTSTVNKPVDVIKMFIDFIPKDLKLGDSEYPERWCVWVAADRVVIKCQPVGFYHGKIPCAAIASEYDGYARSPISRLETVGGMQHVVDFLFNAHIANVRKAINDMLIYDPYMLNSRDLQNPGPGKLVRTRKPAWGRGVKDTIMQLSVNDITRANINDVSFVMSYMERAMGTDPSSMGALRQGGPERLTKGEFEGTQIGKYQRLERIAQVIAIQGFQDIGYFFASHAQQLMNEEIFISVYGPYQEQLMKEFGRAAKNGVIKVSPYDLLLDYDVVIRDGTIPGGNFSRAWMELFGLIIKDPTLRNTFDIVRIFKHIARNSGAKNVEEFVTVQSNEQVQKQVQAGNLVPVEREAAA